MISRKLREAIRLAYDFRCGYCGTHENEVGSELEIDHFHPLAADGSDEQGNLVYCCPACNRNKSDYWPEDEARRLLHPQQNDWTLHFQQAEDGQLMALTERGALHLRRLRLNRPQLVASRLMRQQRQTDAQELTALRLEIERINQHRAELEIQLQEISTQLTRSDK